MNTFDFLNKNFAEILLETPGNNPVENCKKALTMSHLMSKGTTGRLTGWAMVKEGMAFVQSKLAISHPRLVTHDERKRYDAWYHELCNFNGPVCFLEFSKSTVNISNIFITYDLRVVKICGPSSYETFNFLEEANANSGLTHKVLTKMRAKHVV